MEDRNIKPLGFNFFMGTVLFLKDRYIEARPACIFSASF